ncbi:hypothetical protein ABEX25_15775 [Paenibacillus thiaminolyticus]|uniref:hypothetical protein n=1 Tax=Paenibacillus thiaminolyticus TaxID=49283 RepID=UPI003D2B8FAF
MLIDAGAEVIPSLGDSPWLPYDPNYDNELDPMYPAWRSYCTMPTNVVETIRRIPLDHPTPEEVSLINQWIDVITVATFPKLTESILDWFKGKVIFRSFGIPQQYNYTSFAQNEGVDLNSFADADNYVWSPILKCLGEIEDPRLVKNTFYMNYFVSKERLPFKWARKQSNRQVSTLISYIDKSKWVDTLFKPFEDAFHGFDYIVLGRNDKNSPRCQHPSILGNVDYKKMMSVLCNSRILCYGGALSHYHMHFTPLEAMAMQVPVLFTQSCGLAREAMENGRSEQQLMKLGMCKDYTAMASIAAKYMDDFEYLDHLQQSQNAQLLSVFNREQSLASARAFLQTLNEEVTRRRKANPDELVYTLNENKGNPIVRNISLSKSMPNVAGEYRIINSKVMTGQIGEIVKDGFSNHYLRRAVVGVHTPGILFNEQIGNMTPGQYEITAVIYGTEPSSQVVGYIYFDVWNPESNRILGAPLVSSQAGLHKVKCSIVIPDSMTTASKQISIAWLGDYNLNLESVRIQKISDSPPATQLDVKWLEGFSYLENIQGENWRWCTNEGRLRIVNRTPTAKTIHISTNLKSGYTEFSALTIQGPDWDEKLDINVQGRSLNRTITVLPGANDYILRSTANKLNVVERDLAFRVMNFSITELPLEFSWTGGFYSLEGVNDTSWRWSSEEGRLVINNLSNVTMLANISTTATTGYPEPSVLNIAGALWNETLLIQLQETQLSKILIIPPGQHIIIFTCNAPRVPVPDPSTRALVFRLHNFSVHVSSHA